jgi:hypothetical protein
MTDVLVAETPVFIGSVVPAVDSNVNPRRAISPYATVSDGNADTTNAASTDSSNPRSKRFDGPGGFGSRVEGGVEFGQRRGVGQ